MDALVQVPPIKRRRAQSFGGFWFVLSLPFDLLNRYEYVRTYVRVYTAEDFFRTDRE